MNANRPAARRGNYFGKHNADASMKRRDFFSGGRLPDSGGAAAIPVHALKTQAPTTKYMNSATPELDTAAAGITPYAGSFDEAALKHLLNRALFGYSRETFDALKGKSLSQVLDILFTEGDIPSPPVNAYNDASYTDPDTPAGQTWVNAPRNTDLTLKQAESYRDWWAGLMLNEGTCIREKLVMFWQNHFTTELRVAQDARLAYRYNASLRKYALGNFKTMTRVITLEPQMLDYLNGNKNSKSAPDENYGRELQELFTVGKGPDSHYTEDDVKAAARVLTGWRINAAALSSFFQLNKHDTDDKQFSAFYGNKLIKGRADNTAGDKELDDMLDMIFSTREVSRHIVRKLYRYFVYYVISDDTEQNVIRPLAEDFATSGYEIAPTVRALLSSEHFFDAANRGCMIKTPMDHIIKFMKTWDVQTPPAADYNKSYTAWRILNYGATLLQQDINNQPSVAGYPAFHQEPQYHELWINSDTLPKRNQITDAMLYGGIKVGAVTLAADVLAMTAKFDNPGDPNALIDDACALAYSAEAGAGLKGTLRNILLSNQTTDYYWTSAWTAYKNNPGDQMAKNIVKSRLISFYSFLCNQAEYQLS